MADIYWGDTKVQPPVQGGEGELVSRDGETFYKISNYHAMPAFLMSVVSGSDHWMYVSSTGGLTCGRGNPGNSIFPYYTDDKIHDAHATTGPLSVFLVEKDNRTSLWKPFCRDVGVYRIERNLYKNLPGNKLIFEEINHDLGLSYAYCWSSGEKFGIIKRSTLRNLDDASVQVDILDGLRNLLPYGVTPDLQAEMSTLVDAYKQAEAFASQTAAVYTMSSTLTDKAEPSEALKATVVWCTGLDGPQVLLSDKQLDAFCHGQALTSEAFIKGKRGAFFVRSTVSLPAAEEKDWYMLADVNQGPSDIAALVRSIEEGISTRSIEADIVSGSNRLLELVGGADGCQLSSDALTAGRHFSNTLFNIMRGGTFYDDYRFPTDDFLSFAKRSNRSLSGKFTALLGPGATPHTLASLLTLAEQTGDAGMQRLVHEYLPLTFSRRHGDPSRPWNHFSIDIKNEDGSDKLFYQGNWRDIFQNWEALAVSYPEFTESFISKFVNASTADGYNPYRITRDGFEWEVLDLEDPWSNIGYWGDHQINYLLKLLELSCHYHPGKISTYFSRDIFVYADVPYRLKDYQSLLEDPRNSVSYDSQRAADIAQRVKQTGSDGKLLTLPDGSIYTVNLMEKVLVPALVKLGNFVPGGGIWMNTQRPEWNDANNALVGNGLSMVTLCYLRRYLLSLAGLLQADETGAYSISTEVLSFLTAIDTVFRQFSSLQRDEINPADRKAFMDELGLAAERYREAVYAGFKGRKSTLKGSDLRAFIELTGTWLDHSIRQNQRSDGLFHSYNLIQIKADGFQVEHLYEMLEGQVAVLSSGYLDAGESLDLLTALRASKIYRPDQNSYLLYPDKALPLFREKNVIESSLVDTSSWLQQELVSGRRDYVEEDINGQVHFNGSLRNVNELRRALDEDAGIVEDDKNDLCDIYETVFNHRQFTGRSGAMYKYEGLGCIYWHMVSKLLLATGSLIQSAGNNAMEQHVFDGLLERFDDIKDGLGLHKTPALYGAFPVDPYSHTTGFSGVQQPGMTGQVKEDVITRFCELGVNINEGQVSFSPNLLKASEFTSAPQTWTYSTGGSIQSMELAPRSLAFSLCGVPVIYRLAENSSIQIFPCEGNPETIEGSQLSTNWSQSLFRRKKDIKKIIVHLPPKTLRT